MRPLAPLLAAISLLAFQACHSASIALEGFHYQEAAAQGATEQAPGPFVPAPPAADKFDWIKLKSGEWLKGKIDGMRDGSLEFDSDELDDLKLDWDDVAELRSAGEQTILITGRVTHAGKLTIKDGKILLEATGKAPMHFERSELRAFIPGLSADGSHWSGKVSLGATLRSGNTDQTDLTSYMFARRDTAATRWDSKFNGAYSKVSGIETANNQRVDSRFDWFFSQRLFLTPLNLTYYRDPFQNIGYRVTAAAYLGYDLTSQNKMDWDIFLGPAYQGTKADSAQPGVDETDGTAAVVFGTNYGWDITPKIEFDLQYTVTVPVPDSQNYNHHMQAMLSIDLVGSLELDISLIWDRFNNPLADASGSTPEKDDYRTVIGLGFDF